MAKELKVSGNYVIATDLILPNEILGQFPINHCVYRENDNSFILLEQIDNEVVTISKADVDAGEWVDEGSTPFTQATLLTFLRANTGFNTAGGGSPAKVYSAIIAQSGTNAPQVVTLLENTLSGTPVWSRVGVGDYRLTLVGEFTGRQTVILTGNKSYSLSPNMITPYDVIVGESNSPDELYVNTLNNLGLIDNVLGAQGYGFFIEIRVYP